MNLVKASELRKIFHKWSHGTLYNRLETLGIKGNEQYSQKNAAGILLYNELAIDLLKNQYLREFIDTAENDKKEIEKLINEILSSKGNKRNTTKSNEKKNVNIDSIDSIDNVDKTDNVKFINDSSPKEKYILLELHNEIVGNLQKQIDLLEKQLEKETAANTALIDTMKLREQKEVVIEQQNLFKLQQTQAIAAHVEEQQMQEHEEHIQQQDSSKRKRGFFSLFRQKTE